MYPRPTMLRALTAFVFIGGWAGAFIAGLRLDLPIPVLAVGSAMLAALPALVLFVWSWAGPPKPSQAASSTALDVGSEAVSLNLLRYDERFADAVARLAPLFANESADHGQPASEATSGGGPAETAAMRERFLHWQDEVGSLPAQRAATPPALLSVLEIKYQELAAELDAIEEYAATLQPTAAQEVAAVPTVDEASVLGREELGQQRQRTKEARDRAWALALADLDGTGAEARLLLEQAEAAYQATLRLEAEATDDVALLTALRQAETLAASAATAYERALGVVG